MRWLDGIEAVADKAALQLDILSRSSRAVKAGGVLVYATCSLSPLENQDVVTAFYSNIQSSRSRRYAILLRVNKQKC